MNTPGITVPASEPTLLIKPDARIPNIFTSVTPHMMTSSVTMVKSLFCARLGSMANARVAEANVSTVGNHTAFMIHSSQTTRKPNTGPNASFTPDVHTTLVGPGGRQLGCDQGDRNEERNSSQTVEKDRPQTVLGGEGGRFRRLTIAATLIIARREYPQRLDGRRRRLLAHDNTSFRPSVMSLQGRARTVTSGVLRC